MKYIVVIGAIIAYFVFVSQALPGGAPSIACENLTPQHNTTVVNQTSDHPYTVNYTYAGDGTYNLFLTGFAFLYPFKGFILQARPTNNTATYQTFGTFVPQNDRTRPASCLYENDTATHTTNLEKRFVELQWKAPAGNGSVTFV